MHERIQDFSVGARNVRHMLKFLLDVPIRACIESDPAAGAILAHQDWVRRKCGSGLAIATAYGAVRACAAVQ